MLLTLQVFAEQEGLSDKTVRRWIRRHKLPPTKIGRRIYIDTKVFERWKDGLTATVKQKVVVPDGQTVRNSKIAAKMTPLPEDF